MKIAHANLSQEVKMLHDRSIRFEREIMETLNGTTEIEIPSLNVFDLTSIKPRTTLIIGKKHTGKTRLARRIMSLFPDVTRTAFISPYQKKEEYMDLIPVERLHHRENNRETHDSFVKKQMNENKPALLLLEDEDILMRAQDSYGMRMLFMNGPCIHLHTLFISQMYTLPPHFTINLHYVFLFAPVNTDFHLKKIYKNIAGDLFASYEQFKATMLHYTAPPGRCLVINKTAVKSTRIEDLVFYLDV